MNWNFTLMSLEDRGYTVGELLGQGAFSRVYCVKERGTERVRACKISEHTALIRRESEMMNDLSHPLFPEYYGFWQEGDVAFLMLELIQGDNLEKQIREGAAFSVQQTAEIGMELAEGLLYLHERQRPVLFRDVKPENIVLRADGRVKLLDFGCACVSGEDGRSRAGTPGYAAPEQLAEGGYQSALCDVYGLGRTLQELYRTGAARKGRGFAERMNGRKLKRILDACVENEPSARPADMRVIMAALAPLQYFRGGSGKEEWGRDFRQAGVICEKNIWKSNCKTT